MAIESPKIKAEEEVSRSTDIEEVPTPEALGPSVLGPHEANDLTVDAQTVLPDEFVQTPQAATNNRKKGLRVGAIGTAAAVVAGVVGFKVFGGSDSSRPNSRSARTDQIADPNRIRSNQLQPESETGIDLSNPAILNSWYKSWYKEVTNKWTGQPTGGINYPSNYNNLYPKLKKFSENANTAWINRYRRIRGAAPLPGEEVIQILANVKILFKVKGGVFASENMIVGGFNFSEGDGIAGRYIDKTMTPDIVMTFLTPEGKWATTTWRVNGVGGPTEKGLKAVGLLVRDGHYPTVSDGSYSLTSVLTKNSFDYQSADGEIYRIEPPEEYDNIKSAAKAAFNNGEYQPIPMWTLRGALKN